ncbi:hypothetical protein AUR04nite_22700 [Glutamicibacter uratoxydans]|uniref:Uncharacterized protein n=1 Tax=Glutamicibacter uratoxydans TaxID=43667 RepID=A0A4Y4DTQ8_GLUUR|nr:hypothetical protein [Glutamicibacter uratoxydans]GED06738.1 hypothetical protein AUR04nite_22700 [Glutamicibacter uratoxydans]
MVNFRPGIGSIVDYVEADNQDPEFRRKTLETLEDCKPLPDPAVAVLQMRQATGNSGSGEVSALELRSLLERYLKDLQNQTLTGPMRRNAMANIVSAVLANRQDTEESSPDSLVDDLLLVLEEFFWLENTTVAAVLRSLGC